MNVDFADVVDVVEERPRLDRGLRDRLGKLTERKAFGEDAADAEWLAQLQRRDRLAVHHLEEAVAPFEHVARAGHPVVRQLQRKHRLAASVRRREGFPVRQRIGAALARRGVAADRDPDRVNHLFHRQVHQATGADDRRDAGEGRMVDAVAEIIEDIGDLAEDFIGEHGRGDEIAATAPAELGRAQQCGNGIAGMPAAMGEADEGVVEIQVSDHHAVGENRQIGTRPGAAEQDGRALLGADVARELDRDLAGSGGVAAAGAAEGVENGAFDQSDDVFRKILVPQGGRIAGQRLGERNLAARTGRRTLPGLFLRRRRKCRTCRHGGRGRLFEETTAPDAPRVMRCAARFPQFLLNRHGEPDFRRDVSA